MSENKKNEKQSAQMTDVKTGGKYDDDPNIKRVFVKLSSESKKKKTN